MYISELGDLWHRARREPATVHLDSAAASRSSIETIDAVTAHLWREAERGSYVAEDQVSELLLRCRRDITSLIGRGDDELYFRESARSALRALLTGWQLPLSASVWVGTNEFGPNLDEFERRGYVVRTMPTVDTGGHIDTDALQNMLQFEQPDFIHVCHIGAHSATVQPVARVVELAREAGVPVVVDMAQTLGHLDCVIDADVVYGTSRKWLAGPRGVGFVAVRDDSKLSVNLQSSDAYIAGRLGLGVSLQEYHTLGAGRVQKELARIGRVTRERLTGVGSWEVVESVDEPCATTTLAPPPGWDATDVEAAAARLLSNGILLTCAHPWRAPLATEQSVLRVSPHLDVSYGQLDNLAAALRELSY
ncbi:aminotransferase class V-fold PLP-dependent enzyme [Jongsikchunia kroppenstedtii]|uniref:aminotransferase class V-fold PLP-dependent enzyme n=1 Tax=Jongsikchunia kroppenstedtii TaxID=1121721 RepID=UPI00037B5692|nr:aminotransferase class V-fold PLP-dependent enzyme [Jongsikchunia kroppenstedtii]